MTLVVTDPTDTSFTDELPAGTELMLGQYKIEDYLNHGGFGITYLATDSLQRRVVVKECFPGTLCHRSRLTVQARSRAHVKELAGIVKLFMREAQALSKLEHPNIVGVHQVFEDNSTAYMVLDFIEGSDLLSYIERPEMSLSPIEVKAILEKVLDAIGFVHDAGLLHRDISPDNIILTKDLDPKLIDFGAARDQATKATQALSSLRVVKDGYSPQEFYLAGSEQGPASDLYSLAATFYHIITGDSPPDSQVRITAHVADEPDPYVPLAQKTSAYNEAFCNAIDKALAVLPKDRLQSAAEWKQALVTKVEPPKQKRISKLDTKRISRMAPAKPKAPRRTARKSGKSGVSMSAVAATLAAIGVIVGSSVISEDTAATAPQTTVAATTPVQPQVAVDIVIPAADVSIAPELTTPTTSTRAVEVTEPAPTPALDTVDLAAVRTVWADGLISVDWRIDLPFVIADDGQFIEMQDEFLTAIGNGRLSTFNGEPFSGVEALNQQLRGLSAQTNGRTTVLMLGLVDPQTGTAYEARVPTDIIYETNFSTGLRTQTRASDESWLTTVVALPDTNVSDLKIGDELVALVSANERIDDTTSLARLAENALENGVRVAEFALRRDETLWVADIQLSDTAE